MRKAQDSALCNLESRYLHTGRMNPSRIQKNSNCARVKASRIFGVTLTEVDMKGLKSDFRLLKNFK